MITSLSLLLASLLFVFAAAGAERRKRSTLCDALAILAFIAFAVALAINPEPLLD